VRRSSQGRPADGRAGGGGEADPNGERARRFRVGFGAWGRGIRVSDFRGILISCGGMGMGGRGSLIEKAWRGWVGRANRGKRTGAGQRIGGIREHGDAFPFLCASGSPVSNFPDPCLLCVLPFAPGLLLRLVFVLSHGSWALLRPCLVAKFF
jgi:hypothetical protein